MKKKILVSAGGTATAWHLATLIKNKFKENLELLVCDINPDYLVPASILADKYIQVPFISSIGYKETMLSILKENNIDIYVPLIDSDVYQFPCDDLALKEINVKSTGIDQSSIPILSNKRALSIFLKENNINVPKTYSSLVELENTNANELLLKPTLGFGSRGVKKINKGNGYKYIGEPNTLLQEVCLGPEVTIEVYNSNNVIKTICRERIETKSGVCTKTRVFHSLELHEIAIKLCNILSLPIAFCFQVMKNSNGQWVVIDLNPRLGAGTALATAAGWSLASAALVEWSNCGNDPLESLTPIHNKKIVTRVYQEIVMN